MLRILDTLQKKPVCEMEISELDSSTKAILEKLNSNMVALGNEKNGGKQLGFIVSKEGTIIDTIPSDVVASLVKVVNEKISSNTATDNGFKVDSNTLLHQPLSTPTTVQPDRSTTIAAHSDNSSTRQDLLASERSALQAASQSKRMKAVDQRLFNQSLAKQSSKKLASTWPSHTTFKNGKWK